MGLGTTAFGVTTTTTKFITEWREAQIQSVRKGSHNAEGEHVWTKPMERWVKVNSDTALFPNDSVCVMRDSQVGFLGARCCRRVGAWSPREVEAIAMKEALSWLIARRNQRCIMETDSRVLVQACNGKPGEAIFGTLVDDCIQLLKHINLVLVKFIYRSVNNVTHTLDKIAYSMSEARE